jgi:hypothetical protein
MSARDELLYMLLGNPPTPCESELCDCDSYVGVREKELLDAYRAEVLATVGKHLVEIYTDRPKLRGEPLAVNIGKWLQRGALWEGEQ